MRTWLVVLVVVLMACSKKKEEVKAEPPPTPKVDTAPVKDESKQAEPKQDEPKKDPPKAEPEPTVDCAGLITADDVAKACAGAKVEVVAPETKIKVAQEVCRLNFTDPGKKFPKAMLQVFLYESPATAEGMVKLEKLDVTKDVSGVGDRAWTTHKENTAAKIRTTQTTAGAQKGRFLVKAQADQGSLNPKPPCTAEQLLEVVKMTVAKLP